MIWEKEHVDCIQAVKNYIIRKCSQRIKFYHGDLFLLHFIPNFSFVSDKPLEMKSEDHLPGVELFPYFVLNSLELTDLVLTFVSFVLFTDIFFSLEIHLYGRS